MFTVALLGLLAWIRWSDSKGARWYPTRKSTTQLMLELAEVGPQDVVYDLGSGDGRVLIQAAREFGASGVGIEVDPGRHWIARGRVKRAGLSDKITLIRGDIFAQDLSEADVVCAYLRQDTSDALAKKLAEELKPGARIASHTYTMSGLPLIASEESRSIWVYGVPGR